MRSSLLFTLAAVLLGAARPTAAQTAPSAYRFEVILFDAAARRPIPAEVTIRNARGEQVGKLQTDRNGAFTLTAQTAGPYTLAVSAPAYAPKDTTVSAGAGGAATAFNLGLRPMAVGEKGTLASVRFERTKAVLLPESFAELDRLVAVMKANPTLEIQLNGHTDNQGDPALNQRLSEQRVQTVTAYLTRRGIGAGRLTGKGFGGTQPIAPNDAEPTRQLNRRVEVEVVKR